MNMIMMNNNSRYRQSSQSLRFLWKNSGKWFCDDCVGGAQGVIATR